MSNPNTAPKRRTFCPLALIATLTACSQGNLSPTVANMIDYLNFSGEKVAFTDEQATALPYATFGAKIGNSPRSLVVLGKVEGNTLHWFSADKATFITRGGRLVKTVGLPTNTVATMFVTDDPVLAQAVPPYAQPKSVRRVVDLSPQHRFGITLTCHLSTIGPTTVVSLGQRHDTINYREECAAEGFDWRFENQFWADKATGFIWQSRQHYAPGLPPLEYTVLKPAAGTAR